MIDDRKGRLVTPDRRQALFEDVFSQLHMLHTHWRLYVTFFGNREAVNVVRRQAPFTFGILQELLFDAMVLGIGRLRVSKRDACRDYL